MTMDLDPRAGAPFLAKSGQANPDDLLRRLLRQMDGASDDEIFEAFKQAVLKDEELNEACLRYYFINAKTRLQYIRPTAEQLERRQVRSKARATTAYQQVVSRLFILDVIMPNGKPMRECTFGYIKSFGGKCEIIANLGQSDEVIGETVSDKQVTVALRQTRTRRKTKS